jgi:hypothetical protein
VGWKEEMRYLVIIIIVLMFVGCSVYEQPRELTMGEKQFEWQRLQKRQSIVQE